MNVLITGVAGFIGFHLAHKLLEQGCIVTGIDNLNNYYDVQLKKDRLKLLQPWQSAGQFCFESVDLADAAGLHAVFGRNKFTHVINLAAQAGVRYSLINPSAYIQANLVGFGNLLEECRHSSIDHLIFASSSSVYGLNALQPYSEHHNVDHPVSLYAATKKSNELMAHSYSHLYGLPSTGLRFFTVYGPWGRPDMAPYIFTEAILKNKPIKLFNHGDLERDFTYIDDIVESIARILKVPPKGNATYNAMNPDPASSFAPWRIYNIGNSNTVPLKDFIAGLEAETGRKAIVEYMDMQPGDVQSTWADTSELAQATGFSPSTPLGAGLKSYVKWHQDYYG